MKEAIYYCEQTDEFRIYKLSEDEGCVGGFGEISLKHGLIAFFYIGNL